MSPEILASAADPGSIDDAAAGVADQLARGEPLMIDLATEKTGPLQEHLVPLTIDANRTLAAEAIQQSGIIRVPAAAVNLAEEHPQTYHRLEQATIRELARGKLSGFRAPSEGEKSSNYALTSAGGSIPF